MVPLPLPLTVSEIILVAARLWGVEPRDVLGRSRVAALVVPRQAAMWAARRLLERGCGRCRSLAVVGRSLARDHSTVWHGVASVESRRLSDVEFRRKTDEFLAILEDR